MNMPGKTLDNEKFLGSRKKLKDNNGAKLYTYGKKIVIKYPG